MLKRCLTLVGLLYVLSFLPDGSCGTGKITKFDPDSKSGCMYKTEAEARNGLGECETVYPKKPCYYRKCNSNNTTIFNDLDSCKKKLDTNQECTSCGSCYKIVTKSDNTTPDDDTTCTTKADCDKESKAFESNNTYDSNGNECGTCKPVESCPKGYYTIYQSQSDCLTGESFSSSGTANGKVCGKCTYQCTDYTLTSAKDSNCYSCSSCQYDTSKYKCTENVKSGYQLVNGVCSKKTTTESCESKGKHTGVGPWCSECAQNGGTPGPDTDGCFICKQKCSKKYTDKKYKIIDSTETCDTGYKTFSMNVKDDLGNNCYLCMPMQTCADKYTDPNGYSVVTANDTCYLNLFDLNMKDEAGNECYVCRPASVCSDHNEVNGTQYTGKDGTCLDGRQKLTFAGITAWNVSDGPCYPCVRPCSYYGYTAVKPSCSNATSVSTPEGLGCWTCSGSSGSSDSCSGTLTASVTCIFSSTGSLSCTSSIPTCQSKIVNVKVFSAAGAQMYEAGTGSQSNQSSAQNPQISTCKFYGPTQGIVGTASMTSSGYKWSCSYVFTKQILKTTK